MSKNIFHIDMMGSYVWTFEGEKNWLGISLPHNT